MTAQAKYVIDSIEGNRQRLDGGAMFGNVPRVMWQTWIRADDRHRIELACRGFLIHDRERDRRILLETGIGVFFKPKLRDRFGVVEREHVLLENLAARGVKPEQVDVVVLSHLHFDHAGGLLTPWRADETYELVFPEARFVVGERAWERAREPHFRDRASFIPAILSLLDAAREEGRLELVADEGRSETLGPDFSFHLSDGHTPGLLLTELSTDRGAVVFCGDLIPGRPWIHLPVTMGYDRYPELLIDEKRRLLERCLERDIRLLLTHDAGCASCKATRDDKGRFGPTGAQKELSGFAL
jgi:glyoxylase-like metal-dependent hydrolase (beta-lactamase superfamily II)